MMDWWSTPVGRQLSDPECAPLHERRLRSHPIGGKLRGKLHCRQWNLPLIAHEQAVWLIDRLKGAGVEAELLTLEGAGHGFKDKDAQKVEKGLIAFFDRHLKK